MMMIATHEEQQQQQPVTRHVSQEEEDEKSSNEKDSDDEMSVLGGISVATDAAVAGDMLARHLEFKVVYDDQQETFRLDCRCLSFGKKTSWITHSNLLESLDQECGPHYDLGRAWCVHLKGDLDHLWSKEPALWEHVLKEIGEFFKLKYLKITIPQKEIEAADQMLLPLSRNILHRYLNSPTRVHEGGKSSASFWADKFTCVGIKFLVVFELCLQKINENVVLPLVHEIHNLSSLQDVTYLFSLNRSIDPFYKICSMAGLRSLSVEKQDYVDRWVTKPMIEALVVALASPSNNSSEATKKPKLTHNQVVPASLRQLKVLNISKFRMKVDDIATICRAVAGSTVSAFKLSGIKLNTYIASPEEKEKFWEPVVLMIRQNVALETVELSFYKRVSPRQEPIELSQRHVETLTKVFCDENHVISRLDLGWTTSHPSSSRGEQYLEGMTWILPDESQVCLDTNWYGLGWMMASSTNLTKQTLAESLIKAISQEKWSNCKFGLVSCLFHVLQYNPSLIHHFM